jgi:hypothetical protein
MRIESLGNGIDIGFDLHTELFEHVRRTAETRGSTVSMLGDCHTTSGGKDGDRRGNIECPAPTATGAAGIQQHRMPVGQGGHVAAHGQGGADELADRFSLGAQRQQQPADAVVVSLATKHFVDQLTRLFDRQIFAAASLGDGSFKG